MSTRAHLWFVVILLAGVAGSRSTLARTIQPERPETVMITFRAKPGADAELARVIASHWATARRLKLVLDTPHLTLRSSDGRQFVEIMTWRDGSVPDDPPAEIRAIWDEMNGLVETRDGTPGLAIQTVSVVGDTP
jgi:hypothetical protein